jgi:hypothetical protein
MPRTIKFSLESGDVTTFTADVVVLKYARSFHGADQAVALALALVGVQAEELQPPIGEYSYVETKKGMPSPYAMYMGVESLRGFRYEQIQAFGSRALEILAHEQPDARHIAMTLHGVGYGLDEGEAFLAEFKGCLAAIQTGKMPAALEKITIVERNRGRVQRLKQTLDQYLAPADFAKQEEDGSYLLVAADPALPMENARRMRAAVEKTLEETKQARRPQPEEKPKPAEAPRLEAPSENKPHAFIAMPFKKEMDDVFYYGIQLPLHAAGLLCERVDQDIFSGGIMEYVKGRIETAAVVVAELTGGNPNVYLEVGYAWGKGRPVILLARDEKELHFDVRGQRCLVYERIKDLEDILAKELKGMILKGIVKP